MADTETTSMSTMAERSRCQHCGVAIHQIASGLWEAESDDDDSCSVHVPEPSSWRVVENDSAETPTDTQRRTKN